VVMEIGHDIPSPCAHIRLMAFFDAMQARGLAWVRYIRAEDVARYRADIIVTHRTAVTTLAEAEALSAYAAEHRIPLIYDLDDNLTALDPHAENGRYQPLLAVVHHFSASADVIWASTPTLCNELQAAGAPKWRFIAMRWIPAYGKPPCGGRRRRACLIRFVSSIWGP